MYDTLLGKLFLVCLLYVYLFYLIGSMNQVTDHKFCDKNTLRGPHWVISLYILLSLSLGKICDLFLKENVVKVMRRHFYDCNASYKTHFAWKKRFPYWFWKSKQPYYKLVIERTTKQESAMTSKTSGLPQSVVSQKLGPTVIWLWENNSANNMNEPESRFFCSQDFRWKCSRVDRLCTLSRGDS